MTEAKVGVPKLWIGAWLVLCIISVSVGIYLGSTLELRWILIVSLICVFGVIFCMHEILAFVMLGINLFILLVALLASYLISSLVRILF